MSLGRSPWDSLVLKDDKSNVKVANFNDPSMCVYAAILNQFWSVTSSHTHFCHEHATSWVMGYMEVFACDWSKYRN